jgi:serine/threonine protein kinase
LSDVWICYFCIFSVYSCESDLLRHIETKSSTKQTTPKSSTTKITRWKKLSEDRTRNIFKQILDAIQYLHNKSIAHRDLKPVTKRKNKLKKY